MPDAAIIELEPGHVVRFDELHDVPWGDLVDVLMEARRLGKKAACDDCGAPGHIQRSIYGHPHFTHAGGRSCAPTSPSPESADHHQAKDAWAADLAHAGLSVDEEVAIDGGRIDVLGVDKRGNRYVVEPQRGYQPLAELVPRDRARIDYTGNPSQVLWATNRWYQAWDINRVPFVATGSDWERVEDGVFSPLDVETPIALDRGDFVERWVAGAIERFTWVDTEGELSYWLYKGQGKSTKGRRRIRTATRRPAPTVCAPCDLCGQRMLLKLSVVDIDDAHICADCFHRRPMPDGAHQASMVFPVAAKTPSTRCACGGVFMVVRCSRCKGWAEYRCSRCGRPSANEHRCQGAS